VPTALTAFTRKMYCSPVVRPCTTNLRDTSQDIAHFTFAPRAEGKSILSTA
jgi:hypothetical protein